MLVVSLRLLGDCTLPMKWRARFSRPRSAAHFASDLAEAQTSHACAVSGPITFSLGTPC